MYIIFEIFNGSILGFCVGIIFSCTFFVFMEKNTISEIHSLIMEMCQIVMDRKKMQLENLREEMHLHL